MHRFAHHLTIDHALRPHCLFKSKQNSLKIVNDCVFSQSACPLAVFRSGAVANDLLPRALCLYFVDCGLYIQLTFLFCVFHSSGIRPDAVK